MNHPSHRLPHAGGTAGFIQALTGISVAVLVMLGVGGTLYKLIAPGGLIAELFGRSVAGGLAALLALLIIGMSFWIVRAWIPAGARKRYSEWLTYALAGVGLMHAVQAFVEGGL
jgi:hypothetical protein